MLNLKLCHLSETLSSQTTQAENHFISLHAPRDSPSHARKSNNSPLHLNQKIVDRNCPLSLEGGLKGFETISEGFKDPLRLLESHMKSAGSLSAKARPATNSCEVTQGRLQGF